MSEEENPFVVAKDTVTGATHILRESAILAADEGRYEVTDRSPYDHNGDLLLSKPNVNRASKRPAPSQPSKASEPTTPKEK